MLSSSSSSSRHEKGSTVSDQDRRLINTKGKISLNQGQLHWNLEDEKKFASQKGGDSSRKADQLVSRYKRSSCIQVLHSGCQGRSRAKKRVSPKDVGMISGQSGRGKLWGDSE